MQLPTAKIYTRFPVYEKAKVNIVGIFNLKDMLKFLKQNNLDTKVKDIMRNPLFAMESKKLDSMLRLFQTSKQHMAIVLNDKANVVGIVTIENLLEEIVGEIIDESDRINPAIMEISKNSWNTKGSVEVEELNSKISIGIKKDFVDLDSFIVATLNRAPKLGEILNFGSYKITMEDVQGKKAVRVKIEKV